MQRWEALEDMFTAALRKQCPKGTTPIVRFVRICQIPQTPCYANLEYTRSEPPSHIETGGDTEVNYNVTPSSSVCRRFLGFYRQDKFNPHYQLS
jgi:hypothetical protein